ncbi:leucine-rich repeat-containing protein 72 [Dromiciops gliroides]|uniref:leucine-rich repeat-containing protein 72 n=1 Tax=Dromiciops gliroides TaxID=33562 RepID=UPI001CC73361|nr:leucine-rich repeat-containing protein 72 [Dromiciops gliroides]
MTQELLGIESFLPGSRLGPSQWLPEISSTPSFTNTPQELRRDSTIFLSPISPCTRSSSQGRAGRYRGRTPLQFTPRRVATTENVERSKSSKADLSREKSRKAIEDQKKLCGHRRDIDVLELFLSRKGLIDVIDLAKFRRLKHLWLSFNELQDIRFLLRNPCLVELYLDNNSLYAIEGLRHLVSLNVLMLHNNQLKNLDAVVDELKLMNNLRTLNLYRNPLSQDAKQYRMYTVYHLPSLWLLDRKEITLKERRTTIHMFNHEKSRIIQAIAFGRKVDKALCVIPYKPRPIVASGTWEPTLICFFPFRNLFHNTEDAVFVRSMKRSVTQFSFMDWDTVPTRVERHCESKAERPAEWATVRIR